MSICPPFAISKSCYFPSNRCFFSPRTSFCVPGSERSSLALVFFQRLSSTYHCSFMMPLPGASEEAWSTLYKIGLEYSGRTVVSRTVPTIYCYCAYVLRVSRFSSFLLVILTNTVIFLHGLKLSAECRS